MSLYEVKLMPQAQKDLDGFSGILLSRIEDIVLGLYDEPRPHNSKKLSGLVKVFLGVQLTNIGINS